jgi:hypothetical protein
MQRKIGRIDMKNTTQQFRLPKPIEHYLTGDGADADAASQCFSETAVVKADGHTYAGRATIKKWCADVFEMYRPTNEPLACEEKNDRFIVTCRVSGTFPGSPIDLRFSFKLEADKIDSLEVSE